MQITFSSKVQGHSEISSEGISITLTEKELGFPEVNTVKGQEDAFKFMAAYADYLIAGNFFSRGLMGKKEAVARRAPYLKMISLKRGKE